MLDMPQLRKHIRSLEDGKDSLWRQALQSLRNHDEQEWISAPEEVIHCAVEALKSRLLDSSTQAGAQKDIATILGHIGPRSRSALPRLTPLLHEGVPDHVREAVVFALGRIGKDAKVAVDQLVQLLANSRPALSTQAIRALGNIGCADERVRSALVDLWQLPTQFMGSKAQVALALCKLRIEATGLSEQLTRGLMGKTEAPLRILAAEALAWRDKNETDVVPALLTASLSDPKEEVRQVAQAGLDHMRLSHKQAAHVCSRQLGCALYAEVALRKSGQFAVPGLMEALGSPEPAIRVKAARTLGSLGEVATAAAPALTTALRDNHLDVRLAAAKALWIISKKAEVVVPALVDLLEVKELADVEADETRRMFLQSVMEALSRIGAPAKAAVAALTAWAKDRNRHIREAALTTLQSIAPSVASKPAAPR